jgi:anti-sigma factor RsiW
VTCEEIRGLLSPYADNELDLLRSVAIEQHLGECPACAALLERTRSLSSALKDPELYYRAPPGLPRRIRASMRRANGPTKRRAWRPVVLATAAAALVAVAAWGALRGLSVPTTDERLAREVVASHVRSLLAENHRVDVVSSDRHVVKPWFLGKVDVAPDVKDLSQQGFPLIGGRLDYLDDRPAAALVYQREKHVINVFIWRTAERDRALEALERQGYHLIHWTENGRTFWVVSDLNAQELRTFAELLREP